MSAKPYGDDYIKEAKEAVADTESTRWLYVMRSDPLRWMSIPEIAEAIFPTDFASGVRTLYEDINTEVKAAQSQ